MDYSFMSQWPTIVRYLTFIICLGGGIFFLVKFCDYFVDGACAIAKKLKISELVIGLTVVAMGTSFPELAVSTSDSISVLIKGGNANVALGNVIGSNICNLLLVLGFSCLFTPIIVKKSVCKREYPFLLIVSFLIFIFVMLFGEKSFVGEYVITRYEGAFLIVLIIFYIYMLVKSAKNKEINELEEKKVDDDLPENIDMKLSKAIILTIIGCLGIILGGELVVFGAKGFALEISDAAGLNHDLAESLVGLTIVAVGTSLPELVTSIIAAKKGQNELALGNVIGSNIFNALFVLGISSVVSPLTSGSQIIVDVSVMLFVTILVYLFALKGKLSKKHGIILVSIYILYTIYLILRTIL